MSDNFFAQIDHFEYSVCEPQGFEQEAYLNNFSSDDQYFIQHNQAPLQGTLPTIKQTITELINPTNKKLEYKNLPKQIGSKFGKYAKNQQGPHPAGVTKLIRKESGQKQPKATISDLKEMCYDEESRRLFKEFMKSEFLLELMFSNKVEEPMLYVPGICNYYSAADEPDKIKGNYLARKNFK